MSELGFESLKLSEDILKSLKLLGYASPTEVQSKVIPYGLSDSDLIVKSQTGSGKTAAFGIPICEKVDIELRNPQALILTPTRELCVQVKEDITNIGRFKRIRAAAVFGKQPVEMQVRELKQRVHVVVGTPGRTFDLATRGELVLDELKYLVIDEGDKMLNMGFIDQVEDIVKMLPSDRTTMLFSATIPEEIDNLCRRYMKNPAVVEIKRENITSENIEQYIYEVPAENKASNLKDLLFAENPDSCIVFCATKENVDFLVGKLNSWDIPCESLHGGMLQPDRLKVMNSFKAGEFRILIATDVAARGIDIESLSHIINFDVPVEKESYVHRIGRTGRAGKHGKAITFVTSREERLIGEIEEYIGCKIQRKELPYYEDIEKGKVLFNNRKTEKVSLKPSKASLVNKEITKIYIGAGKKKKIRPGDIVGAITAIEGVSSDDIGIIDVQDNYSYVDILGNKGKLVLEELKTATIKGKTVKIQKAVK